MYSYGPPHMDEKKQDDQLEHTYSSYVRLRDVALKTCQRRWTIGKSDKKGSGISVLAARHDGDDDYDVSVQHVSHFATKTWPIIFMDTNQFVKYSANLRTVYFVLIEYICVSGIIG